jgi:CHAT domain-containing protein
MVEGAIENWISAFYHSKGSNDLKRALFYAEKGKSNILLNEMNATKAKSFAGIPDSLLTKERELRCEIAFYEKMRQDKIMSGVKENHSELLSISNDLFYLKNNYEILIDYFENNYPDFFSIKYNSSNIDVTYIQNELLDSNQTMIEYVVGDSALYILVVRNKYFSITKEKLDFPLTSWVDDYLKNGMLHYYSAPLVKRTQKLKAQATQYYTDAAYKLYQKLIEPIRGDITEDLIIIPDGVLGYLPFEALLTSMPTEIGAFATYPFFIKDVKISYSYSAALLMDMKNISRTNKTPGNFLAFAPFYDGTNQSYFAKTETAIGLGNGVSRDSLSPLPGTGEEVERISKILTGDCELILGNNASISAFQEKAPQYKIIHLSTHGKANDENGDYSYIAFSVPDGSCNFEKLFALDLYNYSLNADMVVLSACETGVGNLQKGEGIISLARAFVYAGAKSIFTTLWQVDDEKTKDLFVAFYQNLKDGKPKDYSLWQAKIDFLEKNIGQGEWAHPFFWAGLIGIGDMRALKQ